MLNLFKRTPIERPPFEVSAKGEIKASAERVYDLLDFSSPQNALRERGFIFSQAVGGIGLDDFEARDPELDGVVFHFSVDTYVPTKEICFSTKIESDDVALGNFVESHSHYRLTPIDKNSCLLELTETTKLRDGLSERAFQQEAATLIYSVERHIARLSVHAVHGVEAAKLV